MLVEHSEMKLDINNKRKSERFTHMWKLSSALINDQWIKEKNHKKISKYSQKNENKNINTISNLQGMAKEVLRWKFIPGKHLH